MTASRFEIETLTQVVAEAGHRTEEEREGAKALSQGFDQMARIGERISGTFTFEKQKVDRVATEAQNTDRLSRETGRALSHATNGVAGAQEGIQSNAKEVGKLSEMAQEISAIGEQFTMQTGKFSF